MTGLRGGQVQVWVPVASSKRRGQAAERKLRSLRGSDRAGTGTRELRVSVAKPSAFISTSARGLLLEESREPSQGFWRVKGWATQVQWVFKQVVWLLSQTEKMHS